MTFGEELRRLRKECGVSQRDFAFAVGLDHTYVSKIEKGRMRPPSVKAIYEIADFFGEDIDYLLQLSGRVPRDVAAIVCKSPEVLTLVRALRGLNAGQMAELIGVCERMHGARLTNE